MLISPLTTFIVLQPRSCLDILCWQIYGKLWATVTPQACKHFITKKKKRNIWSHCNRLTPPFQFLSSIAWRAGTFPANSVVPLNFLMCWVFTMAQTTPSLNCDWRKNNHGLPCLDHLHGFFYDCFLIFYSKDVWGITSSKGCVPHQH